MRKARTPLRILPLPLPPDLAILSAQMRREIFDDLGDLPLRALEQVQ